MVRTVEILDMSTLTWRQGLELPEYVTGTSLILINGRPAIVGRWAETKYFYAMNGEYFCV